MGNRKKKNERISYGDGHRPGKDRDALVGDFKNFGGDVNFLTRLETVASKLTLRPWDTLTENPQKFLEGMREIVKQARKLRGSLSQFTGCGDKGFPRELKLLEDNYGLTIKRMEHGASLLGRGGRVTQFENYFWLSALIPYTHFISGKPQWAWIKNYLSKSGKEEPARIKNSWAKMLKAAKRQDDIMQESHKFAWDPNGLTIETLAPNITQHILSVMESGATAYLQWDTAGKNKKGVSLPIPGFYKLDKDKKRYIAILKEHMPFLGPRLTRWEKGFEPLTEGQWETIKSLQTQGTSPNGSTKIKNSKNSGLNGVSGTTKEIRFAGARWPTTNNKRIS